MKQPVALKHNPTPTSLKNQHIRVAVNSVKTGLNGVLNRMIFVRFLEFFRLLKILLEKKTEA